MKQIPLEKSQSSENPLKTRIWSTRHRLTKQLKNTEKHQTKTIYNMKKGKITRAETFQNMKEEQARASLHEVHPEAFHLRKLSWEGMITIRFESGEHSKDSVNGDTLRDDFVRLYMNNFRWKWDLHNEDFYWVSATEFGMYGAAHCHIIFSFSPLRMNPEKIPDMGVMEVETLESLHHICDLKDMWRKSVNVQWEPKFDDIGLVGYICKKESGQEYKKFLWSRDVTHFIDQLFEEIEEGLTL